MPILGDFAVKYGDQAAELGVDSGDLWNALVDTAENTVSRHSFVPRLSSHFAGFLTWVQHGAPGLVHRCVRDRAPL
jgi:hypothetical protein